MGEAEAAECEGAAIHETAAVEELAAKGGEVF